MSDLIDLGAAVIRKKLLPWVLLSGLIVIAGAGGSGLYFGYKAGVETTTVAYQKDQIALVSAQRDALNEKELRRQEAEARAHTVEANFLTALNNIQVINKTFNNTVMKETEKQVYIDCKLPPSGREILVQKAREINAQLMQTKQVSKETTK